MKTKPNKQHDARAASFLRIAKNIRKGARDNPSPAVREFSRHLARQFADEAKLLRSMR